MKKLHPGDIVFVKKQNSLSLYYSYFICLYETSYNRARYLSFLTAGGYSLETFSTSFHKETEIYETLYLQNKHD